jgi:hypothetical protein
VRGGSKSSLNIQVGMRKGAAKRRFSLEKLEKVKKMKKNS